ncbi:bacillithiol biosynthesis deacetylase BshB1 [Prosthecochloris vibrioformis]|uniref:Bacillithiol biosynthesis deacetylase BshB1 n=1 Tax=Prosthecochloris vibrioformis TaxID=1098 RepID=A0A5C4S3E7_PROVB|nr:bacillithiol biosynthesis deacetylase BshB1 [Prosthecochloris vibrioformis]
MNHVRKPSGPLQTNTSDVYALAFGAHPDDVELSCGATLLKIIRESGLVAVCDLTRGEMGTLGTDETRAQEAAAAACAMGYTERVTLDLGDGRIEYSRESLDEVIRIIRRFRPTVVFCNPPDERHPDHVKASRLVCDAAYYAGLKKRLTTWDGKPQAPHRPKYLFHYLQYHHLEPSFIVDISETFEASRKGVLAFRTQFYREGKTGRPETLISRPEFLTGLEARARYFGEQIGVLYGEGFIKTTPVAIKEFSASFG